jgi:hypothetical protein
MTSPVIGWTFARPRMPSVPKSCLLLATFPLKATGVTPLVTARAPYPRSTDDRAGTLPALS